MLNHIPKTETHKLDNWGQSCVLIHSSLPWILSPSGIKVVTFRIFVSSQYRSLMISFQAVFVEMGWDNDALLFLATWHMGSQFPKQGLNTCPQHWKNRILTTWLLGMSFFFFFFWWKISYPLETLRLKCSAWLGWWKWSQWPNMALWLVLIQYNGRTKEPLDEGEREEWKLT